MSGIVAGLSVLGVVVMGLSDVGELELGFAMDGQAVVELAEMGTALGLTEKTLGWFVVKISVIWV